MKHIKHFDNIIFDFSIICYRAFFSLGTLNIVSNDGTRIGTAMPVGILKSFLSIVPKYSHDNSRIIFVVDKYPQRKINIYPEYKKGRKDKYDQKVIEDLRAQMKLVREMIKYLPIFVSRKNGEESDDVIATLVSRYCNNQSNLIVSSDKDLKQLLTSKTLMLDKENILNEDIFTERHGVAPAFWASVQTLCGDPGDNVPGLPGVGMKTAIECVQKYPLVIDDIINNKLDVDKLPNRVKNVIMRNSNYRDIIITTSKLVRLETKLPLIRTTKHKYDKKSLLTLLNELNCQSLIHEIKTSDWLNKHESSNNRR